MLTGNLGYWLRQRLDRFKLKVRAGRRKPDGHDMYYCGGFADGYLAAHRDARKASRADGVDVPALPRTVISPLSNKRQISARGNNE